MLLHETLHYPSKTHPSLFFLLEIWWEFIQIVELDFYSVSTPRRIFFGFFYLILQWNVKAFSVFWQRKRFWRLNDVPLDLSTTLARSFFLLNFSVFLFYGAHLWIPQQISKFHTSRSAHPTSLLISNPFRILMRIWGNIKNWNSENENFVLRWKIFLTLLCCVCVRMFVETWKAKKFWCVKIDGWEMPICVVDGAVSVDERTFQLGWSDETWKFSSHSQTHGVKLWILARHLSHYPNGVGCGFGTRKHPRRVEKNRRNVRMKWQDVARFWAW